MRLKLKKSEPFDERLTIGIDPLISAKALTASGKLPE
jgi:hypothetical protein